MQTNEPSSKETFDSLASLVETVSETSINRCTDRAPIVLEKIERGPQLRNQRAVIVCPGCNTEIDGFDDGLPDYLAWFKESCPVCDVGHRRWSVVVGDPTSIKNHTPGELAELVQEYWDNHLWAGIETAENCARTREFIEAYSEKAAEFDWSWEPSCPLCRKTLSELGLDWLDYHHWRHSPDTGVCLCRECHNAINGGDRDVDVDWQSRELGLRNKHDLQVLKLAVREQQVQPADSLMGLTCRLVRRYNLIQTPQQVRDLIEQAIQSDEIVAAVETDL